MMCCYCNFGLFLCIKSLHTQTCYRLKNRGTKNNERIVVALTLNWVYYYVLYLRWSNCIINFKHLFINHKKNYPKLVKIFITIFSFSLGWKTICSGYNVSVASFTTLDGCVYLLLRDFISYNARKEKEIKTSTKVLLLIFGVKLWCYSFGKKIWQVNLAYVHKCIYSYSMEQNKWTFRKFIQVIL